MDNKRGTNTNYARITEKQHTVILALGCNTDYGVGMDNAMLHIGNSFHVQNETERLITASIDNTPGHFCNSLVLAMTQLSLKEVTKILKHIETICGRTKEETAKGIIRMDIDLMAYDKIRLRPNDWERGYIKELYSALRQEAEL